jgi:hypothetical protein
MRFEQGDRVMGTYQGKAFTGVVSQTRFGRQQGREVVMVYVDTDHVTAPNDVPDFVYCSGDSWVTMELDKSTEKR